MIAAPAEAQSQASAAGENPPRQVGELLELIDDPASNALLAIMRSS